MVNLDPNSINLLKDGLPAFGEITKESPPNQYIESYLAHYSLPTPNTELGFSYGTITANLQSVFTAAWQPQSHVGTAIIVHGYLDNLGLFSHLIKYLIRQKMAVVCFDLPGLGLSDGERAFINDFSDYTLALDAVLTLCHHRFPGPLHGIGQSTGGAILIKHLINSAPNKAYPFTSLNLLAPLLHPKGWWFNRHLIPFVKPFRRSLKRHFSYSSHDEEFLAFLREKDFFQPKTMPMPWFEAAEKWAREFEACSGSDFPVNIIQGTTDKTLDWQYNLKTFGGKFSNMRVQMIENANHHMANEIEPIRNKIFKAIKF